MVVKCTRILLEFEHVYMLPIVRTYLHNLLNRYGNVNMIIQGEPVHHPQAVWFVFYLYVNITVHVCVAECVCLRVCMYV